jgi:hypothetical protein
MKKFLLIFTAVIVLLILAAASFSYSQVSSIQKSMVQVWIPDAIKGKAHSSFGLAVGDGSQILTVFNFENEVPDTIEIVKPGKGTYTGRVQAIDPRYSLMLIKVDGLKLPAASISGAEYPYRLDKINIYGWPEPGLNSFKRAKTWFPGNNMVMSIDTENQPYTAYDGATVTDKIDNIVGLIGTFYNSFIIRLGFPGMIPPMVNIESAADLLSPDAANQSWAKGPAFTLITSLPSITGKSPNEPQARQYLRITAELDSLFNTMGDPLPVKELPADYRLLSMGGFETNDGTLFTALYPYPVELKNAQGEVLAKAKWVGIQWDRREGKPNRLLYGKIDAFGNPKTTGGFILNGDVTELQKALRNQD